MLLQHDKVNSAMPLPSLLSSLNVVIATFSVWRNRQRTSLSGQLWPLLRYFKDKVNRVTIIDHPIAESDYRRSNCEVYEEGKLLYRRELPGLFSPLWYMPEKKRLENKAPLRIKLRDFLGNLYFTLKDRCNYHLYIGVDPLNTLAGIFLRRMGKIGKVVFYETDYAVDRYNNPIINKLYLKLDAFCAKHADYVWNVTPAIAEARANVGYSPDRLAPQITVPVGTFPEQIHCVPYENLEKGHLIFAGGFTEVNGIWTLMDLLQQVLQRVPESRATILGWGPKSIEEQMKNFVDSHKLAGRIRIPGFLKDHQDVEKILSHAYIGIAPFRDLAGSIKRYGDVSKLRMYLACGLPVVTTTATYLAHEIEARRAGLVVQDSLEQLVDATVRLLVDPALHRQCRENAVRMAKDNLWDVNFERAMKQMQLV